MKLHNKNTGEIGIINLKVYGDYTDYVYDTLDSLFKEWEEDKYPLIKDEKLKEIFRNWSKLFETQGYEITHYNKGPATLFQCVGDYDSYDATIELPGIFGESGESYTLEQIIGE